MYNSRIKIFACRFLLLIFMMALLRILFWISNSHHFFGLSFYDFFIGSWFDCITLGLLCLPLAIVYLVPLEHFPKFLLHISNILFFVIATAVIAFNLMDIEYFKYTGKRSTLDLFDILGAGSDFKQQIGTFIIDFWLLFIALFAFIFAIYWIDKRITLWVKKRYTKRKNVKFHLLKNISFYIITIFLLIFLGRGGLVYKPVGILDVSRFVNPSKTALVLNTPFTMLKSIGEESLKEVFYYSSVKETEKYFSPIKHSQPQQILPDNTNVVILILESFGKEFIGFYNNSKTYTPFLDSLLKESLTFSASFANGKKSIEALPSIFASVPSLQDTPYISSPYNANRMIGLPELLKRYGYESAFFHGATNGSMRFDAFAKSVGFNYYVGRKEYGNEQHADKTWGILDEYFEPWTAQQISKLKEPFLASMFTLSSHHPFYIPPHRKKDVIHGEQPIAASISYGDLSLRLFFEEAKKQPWYDNTLFVLCADHTPGTTTSLYNQPTQLYQIPIAYYHPSVSLTKNNSEILTQHADIYPTILDLLNIKTDFYSFGTSIFSKKPRFAVNYLQGNYYYFENNHLLVFSQSLARNLYDYTLKDERLIDLISAKSQEVIDYEKRLKAVIQRYNHDLIHNEMTSKKDIKKMKR